MDFWIQLEHLGYYSYVTPIKIFQFPPLTNSSVWDQMVKIWQLQLIQNYHQFHLEKFEGCHGVLIKNDVALTTKECLVDHGGGPRSYFFAQGMYDEHSYRETQNFRIGDPIYKILSYKETNNDQKVYPELAVMILNRPFKVEPIAIADFIPEAEDPDNNCRIFGWAVWGDIKPNFPSYQMFSTPVQFIHPNHCKGSYDHDLCIDNSNEDICPYVRKGHHYK